MAATTGVVFGIGNPLLDITIEADQAVFDLWGIAPGATALANDAQKPLYPNLIENPNASMVAGGSAQNTVRGVAWLSGQQGFASYTGSVGKDDTARVLKDAATKAGVRTLYYETEKDSTGACAVLVNKVGKDRSLIANIAAANHFSAAHLDTPEVAAAIESAQVLFATGYGLTLPEGPTALVKLAKHAAAHNKIFVFNLAAPFIIEFFWDKVSQVLPYADYIVCNEHEASELAKRFGLAEHQRREAAAKLAALPKENGARGRTVLFTQGPEATLVFRDGVIQEFHPLKLDSALIIDTNGAGDAFTAGIITALAKGVPLEEGIAAGHYAACQVIQRSGPCYPEKCEFVWSK